MLAAVVEEFEESVQSCNASKSTVSGTVLLKKPLPTGSGESPLLLSQSCAYDSSNSKEAYGRPTVKLILSAADSAYASVTYVQPQILPGGGGMTLPQTLHHVPLHQAPVSISSSADNTKNESLHSSGSGCVVVEKNESSQDIAVKATLPQYQNITSNTNESSSHATNNTNSGGESKIRCTNCNVEKTPLWRRIDGQNYLCNACGLYYRIHNCHRPISLKCEEFKPRKKYQKKKSSIGESTAEFSPQLQFSSSCTIASSNLNYPNQRNMQFPVGGTSDSRQLATLQSTSSLVSKHPNKREKTCQFGERQDKPSTFRYKSNSQPAIFNQSDDSSCMGSSLNLTHKDSSTNFQGINSLSFLPVDDSALNLYSNIPKLGAFLTAELIDLHPENIFCSLLNGFVYGYVWDNSDLKLLIQPASLRKCHHIFDSPTIDDFDFGNEPGRLVKVPVYQIMHIFPFTLYPLINFNSKDKQKNDNFCKKCKRHSVPFTTYSEPKTEAFHKNNNQENHTGKENSLNRISMMREASFADFVDAIVSSDSAAIQLNDISTVQSNDALTLNKSIGINDNSLQHMFGSNSTIYACGFLNAIRKVS